MIDYLAEEWFEGTSVPHGQCYLWSVELIGLHVTMDGLIALAYYAMPVALLYLLAKRPDLPFHRMFGWFGAFILLCGTTHALAVVNVWTPLYWVSAGVKTATAGISVATACLLGSLLPKVLTLPGPAQLAHMNAQLREHIRERAHSAIELRRANADLQAALAHKDVLLREVHHRVKNNWQLVTSLLNMQARACHDPHCQQGYQDLYARIHTMGLLNNHLEAGVAAVTLDFNRYLAQLTEGLMHAHAIDPDRVHLLTDATPLRLPSELGIPCGMLAHELIANALKHAFPEGRSGTVAVALAHPPGRYVLTVEDDGVGLPEAPPAPGHGGIGMTLIRALTQQLAGTLTVDAAGSGTRVRLVFPEEEAPA